MFIFMVVFLMSGIDVKAIADPDDSYQQRQAGCRRILQCEGILCLAEQQYRPVLLCGICKKILRCII